MSTYVLSDVLVHWSLTYPKRKLRLSEMRKTSSTNGMSFSGREFVITMTESSCCQRNKIRIINQWIVWTKLTLSNFMDSLQHAHRTQSAPCEYYIFQLSNKIATLWTVNDDTLVPIPLKCLSLSLSLSHSHSFRAQIPVYCMVLTCWEHNYLLHIGFTLKLCSFWWNKQSSLLKTSTFRASKLIVNNWAREKDAVACDRKNFK